MNSPPRISRAWSFALIASAAALLVWVSVTKFPRPTDARTDDFWAFYDAGIAVRADLNPYEYTRTTGKYYIYPPLMAAVMSPVTLLGETNAARACFLFNLALVVATIWLAGREVGRRFEGAPTTAFDALALGSAAALLTWDPLRREMAEIQSDTLVLFAFILALAWLDRLPRWAGVVLGIAVNVKYTAIIALPYLLIRRRWSAAAGMFAGLIAGAILPAIALGWRGTLDQWQVALGGLGRVVSGGDRTAALVRTHDMTWEHSVSITSALARWLMPQGVGGVAVLAAASVVGLATLGGVWLVYRRRGISLFAGRGGAAECAGDRLWTTMLEWCGLLVVLAAFSPQTHKRHLYLLLLVHAACVVPLARIGDRARRPLGLLLAGMVLFQAAQHLPPKDLFGFKHAADTWKAWSGVSWCLLGLYLSLLWVGLGYAPGAAIAENKPTIPPPDESDDPRNTR